MSLIKLSLAGNNLGGGGGGSLNSDIPAGDGKIAYLFYSVDSTLLTCLYFLTCLFIYSRILLRFSIEIRAMAPCNQHPLTINCTVKKEREISKRTGGKASPYMIKYSRISSYIRKSFIIYDFVPASFRIYL
jgi:hypothetical protein